MTTQDTSTRRRVKLYALNADRQWDDRGTGHVTSSYVERLKGSHSYIHGNNNNKIIFKLINIIFFFSLTPFHKKKKNRNLIACTCRK